MPHQEQGPFRFRLPLPSVPLTTEMMCYEIELPNDPHIVGAFEGAIQMLSIWTYWQQDEAHRAIVAANVFKVLYQQLMEAGCVNCKHVNPHFSDALPGGGTKTFHVTVEAGEFQILPIFLLPEQTVSLLEFDGQWRDSTYHPSLEAENATDWETALGVVIDPGGGFPAETFITDAVPAEPHMRLIARYYIGGSPVYVPIFEPTAITIPSSADEDGIKLEFFGNCPLDGDDEIATTFKGYGMICFKAIVSDPNLCGQEFVDFTEPLPPNASVVQGTIVDPSPIGEGPALKAIVDGPSTMQCRLEFALGDCTVRDFAFTYYREEAVGSFGSQCVWEALDADDEIIDSGTEPMPIVNAAQPVTVNIGSVPGVATLRLRWHTNLITFGPQLYIDNVFVN